MRFPLSLISCLVAFGLLFSLNAGAQSIAPTPGTFDMVEGTTMQFDGRPPEVAPPISRYHWEIFSGEGGLLSDPSQPRVTFTAPLVSESIRYFTLQLTLTYASGKKSSTQMNLRVHRKQKTTVYRSSPWLGTGIGFGFGYLWGGWWPYPPVIVIPCPPPGVILPPEDLEPVPLPLPEDPDFDAWLAENPEWSDALDPGDPLDDALWGADVVDVDPVGAEIEPVTGDMERMAEEMDALEPMIEAEPMIEPAPMPDDMDMPGMDMPGMDDYGSDPGGWDAGGFDDF